MDSEKDLLAKGIEAIVHPGFAISVSLALVMTVMRSVLLTEYVLISLMNLALSGVIAPFITWLIWSKAPFYIFGLVAAIASISFAFISKRLVNKLKSLHLRFSTN